MSTPSPHCIVSNRRRQRRIHEVLVVAEELVALQPLPVAVIAAQDVDRVGLIVEDPLEEPAEGLHVLHVRGPL